MASGSNSKIIYGSGGTSYGTYTLAVSFVENSTDIASNTSNITVAGSLTSSKSAWSSAYNSTLAIYWHDNRNDTDVWVNQIDFKSCNSNEVKNVSATFDVTHHNDGTLSGYAFAKFLKGGSSNYTPNSDYIGMDYVTLTNIPRYPVFTVSPSASSIDETQISLSCGQTNISSDMYYRYKRDIDQSYTAWERMTNTTITVGGLASGTVYNFQVQARNRANNNLTTDSGVINSGTYYYPHVTVLSNMTIGTALQVTIYNPLNRTYALRIYSSGGSQIGQYDGALTSLLGFNDSTSVKKQYASLGNALNGTFYINVTYGSNTHTSATRTYSVNQDIDTPSIKTATIIDVNEQTVGLTGDDSLLIINHSTARVTPTINVLGDSRDENLTLKNYTYNAVNFNDYIDITAVANNKFSITATNSRGLVSSAYNVEGALHPWFTPTITASVYRNNETGNKMLIDLNGTSYNNFFNLKTSENYNNVSIKYYVKKREEDDYQYGGVLDNENISYREDNTYYGFGIEITNPFNESGLDEGEWSHLQKYYIKLVLNDTLIGDDDGVIYIQYVKIGQPYFEWWRYNNKNYFNVKGELQVNNTQAIEGGDNYIKMYDGTLIVYGSVRSSSMSASGNSRTTIYFPIEFANPSYSLNLTPRTIITFWTWNRASTIYKDKDNATIEFHNDGSGTVGEMYWDYIIIGRWK